MPVLLLPCPSLATAFEPANCVAKKATISLFDGSAVKTKRHYPPEIFPP
jgi:hypothetical protein